MVVVLLGASPMITTRDDGTVKARRPVKYHWDSQKLEDYNLESSKWKSNDDDYYQRWCWISGS